MSSEAQEIVDVSGDGGVLKRVLVPSSDAQLQCPETGHEVSVHYTGMLENGAVFDSSRNRDTPFTFCLGKKQVIRGWDLAISTMRKGEHAEVTLKPEYAYGELGAGASIPPNATLKFHIELVEFREFAHVDKYSMSPAERLQTALQAKERGNELFKKRDLAQAIDLYIRAVTLLESDDPEETSLPEDFQAVGLSSYLNASNCYLQSKAWAETVTYAQKALAIDPKNCKALYRCGAAQIELGDLEAAKENLVKAARLEPGNPDIRRQLDLWKAAWAVEKERQRNAFGGIFTTKKQSVGTTNGLPGSIPDTSRFYVHIQIGSQSPKPVVFELYPNTSPQLLQRFTELCTGQYKTPNSHAVLTYKGSSFFCVQKGLIVQGGPFNDTGSLVAHVAANSGTSEGRSVVRPHDKAGLLSMIKDGSCRTAPQFMITLASAPQFDATHLVLGQIVSGMAVIWDIEKLAVSNDGVPVDNVTITDCGRY